MPEGPVHSARDGVPSSGGRQPRPQGAGPCAWRWSGLGTLRSSSPATLGAGGVQGARAGPARRGRQAVGAGLWVARRPSQPILHDARAAVPSASRRRRAGAFAGGSRRAAQVGVGGRCQGAQRARWCTGQAGSGRRGREAPVHASGVGLAWERRAAAADFGGERRSGGPGGPGPAGKASGKRWAEGGAAPTATNPPW